MCVWTEVLIALRLSWLGFVVRVCSFGYCLHSSSSLSGLGVGACGLLGAPRLFAVTFWWGYLWRGGVRDMPWVRFVPPPPLLFFFYVWAGGGFHPCRDWVLWCPALPAPVLGPLLSVPLPPFVRATALSFLFSFARHLSSGVCVRCTGCSFLRWAVVLGGVSPG